MRLQTSKPKNAFKLFIAEIFSPVKKPLRISSDGPEETKAAEKAPEKGKARENNIVTVLAGFLLVMREIFCKLCSNAHSLARES